METAVQIHALCQDLTGFFIRLSAVATQAFEFPNRDKAYSYRWKKADCFRELQLESLLLICSV